MPHPNPQFDDALLSAYVDGELTGEERATVDDYLAEHADARQLVAELRELSNVVRDLPREALPFDMVARVERQLESKSLDDSIASKPHVARRGWTSRTSGSGSLRRWQWAAAALAAALLVAVMLPRGDEPVKLAGVDAKGENGAERPAGEPLGDIRDRGLAEGSSVETSDEPVDESTPEPGVIADEERGAAFRPIASATATRSESDASLEPPSPMPAVRAAEEAIPEMGEGIDSTTLADNPTGDAAPEGELGGIASEAGEFSDESLPLVVEIETTRFVLEQQNFDKLLVSNGIVIDEEPLAQTAQRNRRVRDAGRENNAAGRGFAGGGGRGGGGFGTETTIAADGEESDIESSVESNVDEAILVEATPEQFVKCMADLSNNMSVYRSVAIDASRSAEPLRQQYAPQQQKFKDGAMLRKWVADNRAVLEEDAKQVQIANVGQQKAEAARVRQPVPIAAADKPESGEGESELQGKKLEQTARAQVLFSNNYDRAGWAAQGPEADVVRGSRDLGRDGGARGGTSASTAEAESRRSPSVDELSQWANRASDVAAVSELAAENQAAGVPRMKVLFLLKAPAPEPAAAESAPVDE